MYYTNLIIGNVFSYKVTKEYAGVYNTGVYNTGVFILPLLQPLYYKALFRKEKTYLKFKFISIVLISFILPLIIYFTLPNYIYNEGKQIVEQYVHSSSNLIFIDIPNDKDTVPVINNPKQLFVFSREYYYGIKSTGANKYFMVNPLTGKVVQLSEDFWREDKK